MKRLLSSAPEALNSIMNSVKPEGMVGALWLTAYEVVKVNHRLSFFIHKAYQIFYTHGFRHIPCKNIQKTGEIIDKRAVRCYFLYKSGRFLDILKREDSDCGKEVKGKRITCVLCG